MREKKAKKESVLHLAATRREHRALAQFTRPKAQSRQRERDRHQIVKDPVFECSSSLTSIPFLPPSTPPTTN